MPVGIRRLRWRIKAALFPGLDLHTRCRYRYLPRLFRTGCIETLDAGFGNGALSLAAYMLGNRVVGVSFNERDVRETSEFFAAQGIPPQGVELRQLNIYDLRSVGRCFDQIVCSETLEHLTRDAEVLQMFHDMLRPGGRLILCAPYALHPENALGRTNEPENGGHVRDGYTEESYRSLLEAAQFRVTELIGLGSPLLCRLDRALRQIRALPLGSVIALPAFLLALPWTRLDRPNPPVPLSLAVVAERL